MTFCSLARGCLAPALCAAAALVAAAALRRHYAVSVWRRPWRSRWQVWRRRPRSLVCVGQQALTCSAALRSGSGCTVEAAELRVIHGAGRCAGLRTLSSLFMRLALAEARASAGAQCLQRVLLTHAAPAQAKRALDRWEVPVAVGCGAAATCERSRALTRCARNAAAGAASMRARGVRAWVYWLNGEASASGCGCAPRSDSFSSVSYGAAHAS